MESVQSDIGEGRGGLTRAISGIDIYQVNGGSRKVRDSYLIAARAEARRSGERLAVILLFCTRLEGAVE